MFLRFMGAAFVVAGLGVVVFGPEVRAMGVAWLVTGGLILGVQRYVGTAEDAQARILATGKAGRATILEVVDTGVTLNKNPRVRLKVRIDVPGEPPIEASQAVFVSRLAAPRVGEVRDVKFDPQRPDDFAFAPGTAASTVATSPPTRTEDRIGQLERLANLRDRGALSPEEYEAGKRKLLAEL
jgi:hypothetical protein